MRSHQFLELMAPEVEQRLDVQVRGEVEDCHEMVNVFLFAAFWFLPLPRASLKTLYVLRAACASLISSAGLE